MEEGMPSSETSSLQMPSTHKEGNHDGTTNKDFENTVILTTNDGEIVKTYIKLEANDGEKYRQFKGIHSDQAKQIYSVKHLKQENADEIIQYITEGNGNEEYETVYIEEDTTNVLEPEPIIIEIAAEEAQEALTESEEESEDEFAIIGLTEPKLTYFEGIRGRREVLKEFTCPECKKIFSQKGNLLRHYITHTGKKPFGCSLCGQKFSQKSNLQKHIATHNGDKRFVCGVCEKAFVQKANLLRHLRIHTGEKPFGCVLCGHKFTQKANLDKHMLLHSKHTKEIMCQYCTLTFSTVAQKLRHEQNKHENHPDNQEINIGDYRCKECPAKFRSAKTLEKHMTYHM